jgi:hypothetical protein
MTSRPRWGDKRGDALESSAGTTIGADRSCSTVTGDCAINATDHGVIAAAYRAIGRPAVAPASQRTPGPGGSGGNVTSPVRYGVVIRSTRSPRATSICGTKAGANRPRSMSLVVLESRAAVATESSTTPPSRLRGASRSHTCPSRVSVAARPYSSSSGSAGTAGPRDETIDHEPVRRGGEGLLAGCGLRRPPRDQPARDLVGTVNRESTRAGASAR